MIEVVILAAKKINIISKQTEYVPDVTSNWAVCHINLRKLVTPHIKLEINIFPQGEKTPSVT